MLNVCLHAQEDHLHNALGTLGGTSVTETTIISQQILKVLLQIFPFGRFVCHRRLLGGSNLTFLVEFILWCTF